MKSYDQGTGVPVWLRRGVKVLKSFNWKDGRWWSNSEMQGVEIMEGLGLLIMIRPRE